MSDLDWSETEKNIARTAFDRAYEREMSALIVIVAEQVIGISTIDEVWRLSDFLTAKRHDIEGKYDYQYSALLFVFARLVREGWLQMSELGGISPDKQAKVAALSQI